MFTTNSIRSSFLDYFKRHDHKIISSSPLVPQNDPTLMFTNAGMVQFKNIFTGEEKRNYKRATTSQKCIRAGGKHNDLDNVGYTARHHTFFEMLGNFSFGDFFKEEAINFAWEFLTKDLGLSKDKLYITVYHTDDESAKIWKKVTGFSDNKIIRINTNDNFWSMGSTGPCGPSTEIFYDHGDHIWGGLPGTKEEDGDRFIEIWNLVFMQFEQMMDGSKIDLPKLSVDTGMGLERIAAVLQGKHNNYEIDLFQNIINYTADIVKQSPTDKALISYRVIADHLRSSAFLVADGVMPSNEGRGYVLRRIMRRAMRHINQLGYNEPLMHQLVFALSNEMGEIFPELIRARTLIEDVFLQEELKFKKTLGKGMKLLTEEILNLKDKKELSGDTAFKLYDTYGFPLDLTIDALKEKQITVDEKRFAECMEVQKQTARAAWSGSGEKAMDQVWFDLYEKYGATEFLGYTENEVKANVLETLDYMENKKIVITNQTPFYGESGGQTGDIGEIIDKKNQKFKVLNTLKFLGKIHAHIVELPNFKNGEEVTLKINTTYRKALRANHSATHLLHFALRKHLGEHVTQKGSLVVQDRLRFDISHPKSISNDELIAVENEVNELIRANTTANTKSLEMEEAIRAGAIALFGEKYEEEVRVVSMGSSVELCGGTHVNATGDIGLFKIISECAIASGVRRIEAITGSVALAYTQLQDVITREAAYLLKTSSLDILPRLESLLQERKKLEKILNETKKKALISDEQDNKVEKVGNYNFISKVVNDISPKDLRSLIDSLRASTQNGVIVGMSNFEGKTSIVIGLNNKISDLDASVLIKAAIEAAGGKGGGGRSDIAQAGGFDFGRTKDAVEKIKELIG